MKPKEANTKLRQELRQVDSNTGNTMLNSLASKNSRKRVYQKARKTTQPESFEPTMIPEHLTVILNHLILTIF